MVRFRRSLSSPSSGLPRLSPTGSYSVAACFLRLPPSGPLFFSEDFRWKLFIAWCNPVVVSSPAFYVYRTSSAVWGRCSSAKKKKYFPLEASHRLVQSCRRVVTCFLRLPHVKRRLGAAVFRYGTTISFIYSVSPVCPFLPLLFASGLRSERRWSLFLILFPAVSISCSRIALQTLQILQAWGFEGFLPSPGELRGKIDLFLND